MSDEIPGADILGFGYDIFGTMAAGSRTLRVLPPLVTTTRTHSYDNVAYAVPDGVSVTAGDGRPMTAGSAFVAETGLEIQNHFAAKANISGTYGGFSGEVEALFGTDSSSSQSSWYGIVEGTQQAFQIRVDDVSPGDDFSKSPEVTAMLLHTKFDPSQPDDFFRVFAKFGTHFINQVTIGARVDYAATVARSAATSKMDVGAKLSAEYKAVTNDKVSADIQADWSAIGKDWANSRRISIAAIGGTSKLLAGLDPSYGESYAEAYGDWLQTVDQSPGIIDFNLLPLSALFSGSFSAEVDKAIKAYIGNGVYVEALVSNQTYSGLIEVSGAAQSRRQPAQTSGGAQLVVIDGTGKPVFNNVVYGCEGQPNDLWDKLVSGAENYAAPGYYPILSVFAWYSNYYPSPKAAAWLESCGASLEAWRNVQSAANLLTYVLIGQGGSQPGSGIECIDWDHGQKISMAALAAPLVPKIGGGFNLRLGGLS